MMDFFAGAHTIDLILSIIVVEVVAITAYWYARRRGIAPSQLVPNVLAGALLLIALRLVLTGYTWPWYLPCLALAGVANVADIRQRWQ